MEAYRWFMCIEEDGSIVKHPWVDPPAEITLAHVSRLHYHNRGHKRDIPPCAHNDGLSSYYHLPYTPDVWENIQKLVHTFNTCFAPFTTFLTTVSLHQEAWETYFLEQWQQFSLEEDVNKRKEKTQ
jgi:hypothetical protein